ncbi:MAG: Helix-turn-helix domain protein [Chloroflexi bacterium ADurb.Bin325]|nr:MAG: Helix-turn-helix domain protein [Chloroflexi bacterium ADurb.Bin325]
MNPGDKLTREIAGRVRAARERAEPKLTQDEMGERLGLSRVAYGHYERGLTPFTILHLFQVAHILGQPVEYFLGLTTDLHPDEQLLVGAYRRLDGSVHQARVLIAFLELCRLWDETPPASQDRAKLLPVIVAQQTPDGNLQLVRQGLMDVLPAPDLSDYEPVDGQPLSETEWELVNCLRRMTPEELKDFESELQARVSGHSASQA